MVYTLRFSPSKCSLFHNSNVFGSYIIHILYTGRAKIKKILNILNMVYTLRFFPSKCSLFRNSNVFCSYIIHILYTGRAKIKKILNILNMVYNLRFFLQNAVCFIILTYLVRILFTFYIQDVLKLKKK